MDFYKAVESRRTVRDFEDRPVPPEVVERIIDAGLKAPTNNHMREWEFILLNDMETRLRAISTVRADLGIEESTAIIDAWGLTDADQRAMYLDGIPKQHRMLLTAGCLILPLFRQEWPLLMPETLSSLNGFASMWCVIENMLLAAAAEGLGGVTRIPFEPEIVHLKAFLGIPKDYEIACYLALGYPANPQQPIRQIPVSVREKLHFNRW